MTVAKGYTNPDRVAGYLGTTFDNDQLVQCDRLIRAAEARIDRLTGRAWMVGSPAVEERLLTAPYFYLHNTPVTAISSITLRGSPLADPTPVDPGAYRLVQPSTGLLYTSLWPAGQILAVTYTHDGLPIPEDLAHATTELTIHWLRPSLGEPGPDVRSYSVGGELTVTRYDTPPESNAIPEQILATIRQYKAHHFV